MFLYLLVGADGFEQGVKKTVRWTVFSPRLAISIRIQGYNNTVWEHLLYLTDIQSDVFFYFQLNNYVDIFNILFAVRPEKQSAHTATA